jgi:RNA polymerase sigma factor (sigma-70 family)
LSKPHSENNMLNKALAIFMGDSKVRLLSFLSKFITLSEAEEIAQEAYLKLYFLIKDKPNHHDYLDLLHDLRPMLMVIARNLALSLIRHQQVESKYAESQATLHCQLTINEFQSKQNTEELAISNAENLQLILAINRLPPICRQVFIQRKLHEKSHQQIAGMLNISTKTVENHLSKGLVLCRKYMLETGSTAYLTEANETLIISKAAS